MRVIAPALMFTELRTMTEVTGSPPKNPATMFPTPCATSSRLGGLTRLRASSLSTASRFSRVSSEATMASVTAAMKIAGLRSAAKSGLGSSFSSSPRLAGVGTCTKCDGSIAHELPAARRARLIATPSSTTTSGAGTRDFFIRLRSQAMSTARETKPTSIAPG